MRTSRLKPLLSLILIGYASIKGVSQNINYLVNAEWKTQIANPSANDRIVMSLTNSGDLVTISNNKIGANSQIHLNCRKNTGVLLWQQNTTGAVNNDSYGVDTKTDANGNIYTCSAFHTGQNYNYRITKHDANSNLIWQQNFNGIGNGDDIPAALELDNNGNIYVTGSSYGLGTLPDYATLKLDNSGVIIWTKRYNNNNLPDVATDIALDANGNIFVVGSSATSFNNADITLVKYSNTGTQLATYRYNYNGNGLDLASEMKIDASNAVYIAGSFENGTKKMGILKLNNALTLAWANLSTSNVTSEANGLTLENTNVVSIGYQNNSNGGSDIVINKHNTSGVQVWQRIIPNTTNFSKGRKVVYDPSGMLYIVGDVAQNGNKDFLTAALDLNGEIKWAKFFNSTSNSDDVPYDIKVKNNNVYVSGISTNGSTKQLSTVKYAIDASIQAASTTIGVPPHVDHELIIRFRPTMVDTTKLNNRDIQFGIVADFLNPQGLLKLRTVTGLEVNKLKAYKVFPKMRSVDSVSISRTGKIVKLLPFYATIVIQFPNTINDTLMERVIENEYSLVEGADLNYTTAETSNYNKEILIPFAEQTNFNSNLVSSTNDPSYVNGNSAGQDATTAFPNSGINMTPAWAIESGNPNIIVGIYDSGINNTHSDFSGSGLVGTKIKTGYDYYFNLPYLTSLPVDKFGHGTCQAGIVGAIRNNGIAVAGIAGGDATIGNTGVTLNDMKIMEGNTLSVNPSANFASFAVLQQAMLDGALSSPTANIGFAQNVQNHSWMVKSNAPFQGNNAQLFRDIERTVLQNDVTLVFGSGNIEIAAFTLGITNLMSDFNDNFSICVGAINATGNRADFSSRGKFLDVMAPGTNNLYDVLSKNSNGVTDLLFWGGGTNTISVNADGTSMSAPHVAGVASLLYSYINNHPQKPNNLAPEDVEKLIEKFATDLYPQSPIPTYSVGYDQQTGYGRVNAGLTLQKIKLPDYNVKHFDVITTIGSCNVALSKTLELVYFPVQWQTQIAGTGAVNKYEVTYSNPHTIGNYQIKDAWVRNAVSDLPGNVSIDPILGFPSSLGVNDIPNEPDTEILNYTSTNANLRGYCYEILNFNGTIYVPSGEWYPFNPFTNPNQQVKFGYTLYLEDLAINVKENTNSLSLISIYPNPANDKLILNNKSEKSINGQLTLIDVTGRLINEDRLDLESSQLKILNTEQLINGIYFLNLKLDNGSSKVYKLIITH
jgi:subtilisin family serine protease